MSHIADALILENNIFIPFKRRTKNNETISYFSQNITTTLDEKGNIFPALILAQLNIFTWIDH